MSGDFRECGHAEATELSIAATAAEVEQHNE